MNKFVVAALVACTMVTPAASVNAAPLVTDEDVANCLVLPALKKECWELGRERAVYRADQVAMAMDEAEAEYKLKWPVKWWECTRAPEGAGYLFAC